MLNLSALEEHPAFQAFPRLRVQSKMGLLVPPLDDTTLSDVIGLTAAIQSSVPTDTQTWAAAEVARFKALMLSATVAEIMPQPQAAPIQPYGYPPNPHQPQYPYPPPAPAASFRLALVGEIVSMKGTLLAMQETLATMAAGRAGGGDDYGGEGAPEGGDVGAAGENNAPPRPKERSTSSNDSPGLQEVAHRLASLINVTGATAKQMQEMKEEIKALSSKIDASKHHPQLKSLESKIGRLMIREPSTAVSGGTGTPAVVDTASSYAGAPAAPVTVALPPQGSTLGNGSNAEIVRKLREVLGLLHSQSQYLSDIKSVMNNPANAFISKQVDKLSSTMGSQFEKMTSATNNVGGQIERISAGVWGVKSQGAIIQSGQDRLQNALHKFEKLHDSMQNFERFANMFDKMPNQRLFMDAINQIQKSGGGGGGSLSSSASDRGGGAGGGGPGLEVLHKKIEHVIAFLGRCETGYVEDLVKQLSDRIGILTGAVTGDMVKAKVAAEQQAMRTHQMLDELQEMGLEILAKDWSCHCPDMDGALAAAQWEQAARQLELDGSTLVFKSHIGVLPPETEEAFQISMTMVRSNVIRRAIFYRYLLGVPLNNDDLKEVYGPDIPVPCTFVYEEDILNLDFPQLLDWAKWATKVDDDLGLVEDDATTLKLRKLVLDFVGVLPLKGTKTLRGTTKEVATMGGKKAEASGTTPVSIGDAEGDTSSKMDILSLPHGSDPSDDSDSVL